MQPYRALFVPANIPARRESPATRPEPTEDLAVRPAVIAVGIAAGVAIAIASLSPIGLILACHAALGTLVYQIAR